MSTANGYCRAQSLGGDIELKILSQHFGVEITALHTHT